MSNQETVHEILLAHPCPDCGQVRIVESSKEPSAVCGCCRGSSAWNIETIRHPLTAKELLKLSKG